LGSTAINWVNGDKQLFYRNDGFLVYKDGKGNNYNVGVDGGKTLYDADGSSYVVNSDGSKFLYDANGKLLYSSPPSLPKAK
jgi:hypothetical protein